MTMLGDTTTQTARTQHRCHWCGERIVPGEEYVRWLWKDHREVSATKAHSECFSAWGLLPPDESEEVMEGQYSRGCTCANGDCRCGVRDQS